MVLLSRTCGTDTALNILGVPLLAQVMSPENDAGTIQGHGKSEMTSDATVGIKTIMALQLRAANRRFLIRR